MVRKRLDERVRTLIERGVVQNERSILVLVGDHGKDQVPNLHQILSKTSLQQRPNVLWCYKKELGFSTHRKKRIKKLKRDKARGLLSKNGSNEGTADNFELFIGSTDVNWCYYKDSHRVLGSTVGMLILQDFEALTPNLMARTIETVKGGGLVVFLMRTVKSLKQLYTMTMDVHARYRTESSGDLVPRFNERFILSLAKCGNCLVCDDELNVLPVSRKTIKGLDPSVSGKRAIEKGDAGEIIQQETPDEVELRELKESLYETPHVGVLVDLAKTVDQAKALLVFLEACSEKTNTTSTVAMTAARGRGKSAAMGLCLAGAISLGYSTMAVTAPEPENLVSVFDFLCRGLKALKYQEHLDYTIKYNQSSGREAIKCVVGIQIHRSHRQIIQYIAPHESDKFSSAEIVAVDEAAAIPLPIVRKLMQHKDRLTFLSSTVNGYEGTGRALSLKLIKELRESKGGRLAELNVANAASREIVGARSKKGDAKVHEQRYKAAADAAAGGTGDVLSGPLREIELSMPIRYAKGDGVEAWLNKLLCLDSGSSAQLKLNGGAPAPGDCELYSVDRDALFSYHKLSEAFLQKLMGLYTSAHYKNTPNDLQMLSDAPAHAAFVLLSPSAEQDADNLPDILAVVQVALEGKISRKAVEAQLARGHRSAGDLIPWTIAQQFGDSKFAQLSGARIVRIAVHPSVQGMGYGTRAVELLYRFYNGEMVSLDDSEDEGGDDDDGNGASGDADADDSDSENDDDGDAAGKGIQAEKLAPRKELPPLLLPLTEVESPKLDWIGTSFGLTLNLHKFWSRAGMQMLYLRQTKNELTGEHSSIMVRALPKMSGVDDAWLDAFVNDSKRRYLSLLAGSFRDMGIRTAISVLDRLCETRNVSAERSGVPVTAKGGSDRISAEELGYYMTPHDMKRLELYGRNLCDHHLITDLLPVVARMYFGGRLGRGFKLSSVQSAILCGLGIQNRVVDSITKELGLPSNQVLAMFNKAVRKISIALYGVVEAKEREGLLGGDERKKAQEAADGMADVAGKTLEEDAADAAKAAIEEYNRHQGMMTNNESAKSLPASIANDKSLMRYAVKGSDEQWNKILDGKDDALGETKMVSVRSVREKRKSSSTDADAAEKEASHEARAPGGSGGKKNSKKNKKKARRQ